MGLRRGGTGLALAALLLAAGCSGGAADGPGQQSAGPAGPTSSAAPTPSAPAGPYVALGDSYTSGLKVPPQGGTPAGCYRSGANYPSLVAAGLGLAGDAFRDVSCSSARAGELARPQHTPDGTNPPQLDALSPATRLVTVGIGGNDAGFMEVVTHCARESLLHTLSSPGPGDAAVTASACRASYAATGGGPDEVERRVAAAGEKVAAVLAEIRRRSPSARLYVVGYPALLPSDPARCRAALGEGIALPDIAFLTEKMDQLNEMLRARAAAAGAVFVDTAAVSAGHDMCAGESQRWVEPVAAASGAAPLHPNARGERGMAEAVLSAVRR
ncbi:SGNH/GDSL hydrolase family protein [Kitasatospora sp. KL5]|uniref:SGNH/GDSL hydrolase family protein n=1 Tax=Kitasatospora sp. KL5 TaxID=3425125 RepID=UPI003D6E2F68